MAALLAREDVHLIGCFGKTGGADFVGNRLDLCFAVRFCFLYRAHEAPEIGRVFAIEHGIEASVDSLFIGCSNETLGHILKALLACELR